jgi:LacI family transcriptional regulator
MQGAGQGARAPFQNALIDVPLFPADTRVEILINRPKGAMRPTVNDLAREAGVSLATVDRVLNARPGVREKTIAAVNEAIQKLGYVRDVAAANLARQRSYRLAFVLPDNDSQFVDAIAATLSQTGAMAATARTETTLVRFPPEDGHALAAILQGLAARKVDGVALMAPETPVVRDAVRALTEAGIAVVALVSDLPNTQPVHFVGIDNRAAGQTAGVLMGRFLRKGRVAVIAGSMHQTEAVERRHGFDAVMLRDFPQIEVLPTLETHGNPVLVHQVLADAGSTGPIDGIYILGSGLRALTDAVARLGLTEITIIAHELTAHARVALLDGRVDAIITQNIGHLVRSALRVLRAQIDGVPMDAAQEQIRIEILIRENLPEI